MVSNLRRLMFDRYTNISTVSRETGISRTTLTALCKGTGSGISFAVLEKLCAYFKCGVGDLLVLVESDENKAARERKEETA